MPKVSIQTVLKRYQVQCIEIESLRGKSITGTGLDTVYTDYVTCQGTHPARLSGEDHKKCGRRVSMANAYKCLYCSFWFCLTCAEKHFGKTKEQHNTEMENKE
jgi:hypothetical protein